jgi:branched-chain amino acid transport system substrate-binding protein
MGKNQKLAAFGAALLLFCLAAAQAQASETIKLGLIEGLSGPFANAGASVVANLQIAIAHVNEDGGVLLKDGRHRLELVTYDSQSSPEQALLGLTQMADQGVRYILEGNSSAVALALVGAIEKRNARDPAHALLFLNYSAVDPALTNEHCSFWHFRFDANADMRMNALTEVLRDDERVHRVFLIDQDYGFGREVAQSARQMLAIKRPDIEIVGDVLHPIGQVQDFTPYVSRIAASHADAVITGNWGSDLSLLVKAAREAGLTARFYTFYADSLGAPSAIGASGVNRVLAVSEWNPNSTPAALAAARAFRARFTDPKRSYQFLRIGVMVEMFASALQRAQTQDARAVALSLEAARYANGFYEASMRARDHQIEEPLFVSKMVMANEDQIDSEGSGYAFVPQRYFPPPAVELPTTCAMQR